jgi:ABC-type phosphate transport system substrate-binding protein
MKPTTLALLAGLFALMADPAASPAQDFAVIVNASNPVSTLSKDEVAKLFLKKTVAWQSGQSASPVELPATAKVREAFAREVLNKSVAQVRSYWQQQIFSGRDVPPPEKPSEDEVLAFVRANPNAIGYVSRTANMGRGVKVVSLAP